MPTATKILGPIQQRHFNAVPKFGIDERTVHFTLCDEANRYMRRLRTVDNKVSFILQYGYFCAKGRFFEARNYRAIDIKYIHRLFNFPFRHKHTDKKHYAELYGGASSLRHRKKILDIKQWNETAEPQLEELRQFTEKEVENQMPPDEMIWLLHARCWELRWVMPSYDTLSQIINTSHEAYQNRLTDIVKTHLTEENKSKIDELLLLNTRNKTTLSVVKNIEQSTRKTRLDKNAELLETFKHYFFENQELLKALNFNDAALSYYYRWVMGAKAFQINQFKNPYTGYLHLIGFIQYQYYLRQDAAIAAFLERVKNSMNKAKKKAEEYEQKYQNAKNKAIDAVTASQKRLAQFADDVLDIVDDQTLSKQRRLDIIRNQAIELKGSHDDNFIKKAELLDECRDKEQRGTVLNNALKEECRALSASVGKIIQLVIFDEEESAPDTIAAIDYYKNKKGNISSTAPTQFLAKKEKAAIFDGDTFNKPLYKIFLYQHIVDSIKSGKLSLEHSFEYRALNRYLIPTPEWESTKQDLISIAGLSPYSDIDAHLAELKAKLDTSYTHINEYLTDNIDGYLKMNPKGRFRVKTPAIDYEQSKYISTMLSTDGEVAVIQVLREAERICGFNDLLSHHTKKHAVKHAPVEVNIAGMMALGCNIGARQMAGKSIGIKSDALLDTIKWRFSNKNLYKVNQSIIDAVEALELPNVFKIDDNKLYSSSDGKKITVAVDSLIANHSYKYYGKDKGVSIYTFINEKQTLFHSTVFSSSDREAIYLVDGLLHNTSSIHHIHSTDTHGYKDAVFAATHMIGVSFAPRFKRIEDLVTYSFQSKAKHQSMGHILLPSREIRTQTIKENWDDILRFMASIKLGRTTASQLFKRLNSYSKSHPLYESLKEFGRIIKTQHMLTYYNDLEFRQQIQKQLNRVELSNKFSDAVFWDRGKQFHVGTKEAQEQQTLCKMIIQNSIILWNYLFLSDRLLQNNTPEDRKEMVESIKKGSVLAWKHINFSGQYDFSKPASKDYRFNYSKIKRLKLKNVA